MNNIKAEIKKNEKGSYSLTTDVDGYWVVETYPNLVKAIKGLDYWVNYLKTLVMPDSELSPEQLAERKRHRRDKEEKQRIIRKINEEEKRQKESENIIDHK